MNLAIAVPMKGVADAKTRLAPALADPARHALAEALYRRTLCFFRERYPAFALFAVTESESVARLAVAQGATVLAEPAARGLNAAADTAARYAAAAGFDALLLVHADIPQLHCDEVDALIAAAAFADVALAESTDGGTNALLLRPPLALPFRYGPGSADRHAEVAHDCGLSVARLKLTHLSRDLDTPTDLVQFGAAGWWERLQPQTVAPRAAAGRAPAVRLGVA